MQGRDLAPDDFSNWQKMLNLGCDADDKSEWCAGPLHDAQVLLKDFCHVTKAKLHKTEVSGVEITLSEPLLLMRSARAPTFC